MDVPIVAPRTPITPPTSRNNNQFLSHRQAFSLRKDENGEENMVKQRGKTSIDSKLTHSPNGHLSAPPVPTTPSLDTKNQRYAQNISTLADINQDPPADGKAERKVKTCTNRDSSTHMETGIETTASRILNKRIHLHGRRQGDTYFPR